MNGAIIVNKPSGITSRDVVNKLTRILQTKKIGHIGTLDPMASGVLVCLIGKYTKLANILVEHNKEYIATFKLGILTDTLDITGKIIKEESINVNKEEVINTINSFIGSYEQEVPIYSAIKVNGKKLYEYARNNQQVILPKKKVVIHKIEIVKIEKDEITIKTKVSKGTYIRSLVRDIGQRLGTYATLSKLERIKLGSFTIKDSYTIDEITNSHYKLLNVKDLLNCSVQNIDKDLYDKIQNGQILNIKITDYILFKYKKKEVAIYQKYLKDENKIKPLVIF